MPTLFYVFTIFISVLLLLHPSKAGFHIVGKEWEPVDQTVYNPAVYLRFNLKQIEGEGGCNKFQCSYEIDQELKTLQIGRVGKTVKECDENNDLDKEKHFVQALRNAETYELDDSEVFSRLTLIDAKGLVTLELIEME